MSCSSTLVRAAPTTAVSALNTLLGTAIDLQAQLKQAHWNVSGPGLVALHAVFDRAATDVGRHTDMLAERTLRIGGHAAGTIQIAATQSVLPPYPTDARHVEQNVMAASAALIAYETATREAIDSIRSVGDFATADLLGDILRGTERSLWWIGRASQHTCGNAPVCDTLAPPDLASNEISMRERIENWVNSVGTASPYPTQP